MIDFIDEIYHFRKSNWKNIIKAVKHFVLLKFIHIFIEIITKTTKIFNNA